MSLTASRSITLAALLVVASPLALRAQADPRLDDPASGRDRHLDDHDRLTPRAGKPGGNDGLHRPERARQPGELEDRNEFPRRPRWRCGDRYGYFGTWSAAGEVVMAPAGLVFDE